MTDYAALLKDLYKASLVFADPNILPQRGDFLELRKTLRRVKKHLGVKGSLPWREIDETKF